MTISDGLNRLGLDEIGLDGSLRRLKAVQDCTKEKRSFFGALPDTDGTLKFVSRMESIE